MHAVAIENSERTHNARGARVLLADPDPAIRRWLLPVLQRIAGHGVVEIHTGHELEAALFRGGDDVDLVVTNARLDADSALASLARVRAAGATTPFIVYTSFQESLMRVLVSGVEGSVLSSRVVDLHNLGELAKSLLRQTSH